MCYPLKGRKLAGITMMAFLLVTALLLTSAKGELEIPDYYDKIDSELFMKLPSMEKVIVWVEFMDRPFYGASREECRRYLDIHSGLPPVSRSYIEAVAAMGFKHRAVSELSNEASFEGPSTQVYSIVSLPFVKRISEVLNGWANWKQVGLSGEGIGGVISDRGLCQPDSHSCTGDHNQGNFPNSVPIGAVNLQNLHNNGNNGSGIKIGIVDSGIKEDSGGSNKHETFDCLVTGGAKISAQKDIARDDFIADDEIGHGTTVAGVCAGFVSRNGGGVFNYIGAAPDAQMAIAKFSYMEDDEEHWDQDLFAEAVKWCVDTADVDILVVTTTWGGTSYPYSGYNRPARWCDWAAKQGVIVCVAAGNDFNPPVSFIRAPAGNFNCITVAATRPDGNVIADYSQHGPAKDGRIKPDVAAPGGVDGSGSNYTNQDSLIACPVMADVDHYAWFNGTSYATPYTAGAIACMLEADNTLIGEPLDVRMRLWETAVDKGPNGTDTLWGFGLLDINAANNSGGYANFMMIDAWDSEVGFIPSCDRGDQPELSGQSNGVGIYQGEGEGDAAFWCSPAIFVDNDGDGSPDDPNQPVAGQTNTFKFIVKNVGEGAGRARVFMYTQDPNTGMRAWNYIGQDEKDINPGDYDTMSVDWDTPELNGLNQKHWCIVATLEDQTNPRRDDDNPIPTGQTWGSRPLWNVVKCDNMVMRNFWVQSSGSVDSLFFVCENTADYDANITLGDVSTLPGGWSISFDDTSFFLNTGTMKICTLFVDIPDSAVNGQTADISFEAVNDSGDVLGGIRQVVKKAASHHFDDCTVNGWNVGNFGGGMFDANPDVYVSFPCGLTAIAPGTGSAAWGVSPPFGLVTEEPYIISTHFMALTPDNENFQVLNNEQVIIELDYPCELVALQPSGPAVPLRALNPGMWYTITVRSYPPPGGFFDVYLGELGAGETLIAAGLNLMSSSAADYLLLGDTDSTGSGRGECAWDDILISGNYEPVDMLNCELTVISERVPSVEGDILFDLFVANTGTSTFNNGLYGELYPIIGDCVSGTPFDFNLKKHIIAESFAPGEHFAGNYYYHVVNAGGNFNQAAIKTGIGPT
ncbi:MAG: S8 family serine peptidase, partial [candidate division Zixibacteria bacterium]|nr:S8 family serine peptidase [candidate division Zixibacteria bacterium]